MCSARDAAAPARLRQACDGAPQTSSDRLMLRKEDAGRRDGCGLEIDHGPDLSWSGLIGTKQVRQALDRQASNQ